MPIWTQLAEPVALSISDALTEVLKEQAPEEMQGMLANAGQIMRSIGGALFAMQLGQVVGQLATEVVSGGDIGIPLLEDGHAALLPQNVAEFGEGLDIPDDQVQLYLAVRELAHARLFRHAKWLRLQLITSITEFANGITIDTERLEELAEGFDPANPEELREAMVSGALIPPKTGVAAGCARPPRDRPRPRRGLGRRRHCRSDETPAEGRRHRRDRTPATRVRRPGRVGVRDARRTRTAAATPA